MYVRYRIVLNSQKMINENSSLASSVADFSVLYVVCKVLYDVANPVHDVDPEGIEVEGRFLTHLEGYPSIPLISRNDETHCLHGNDTSDSTTVQTTIERSITRPSSVVSRSQLAPSCARE